MINIVSLVPRHHTDWNGNKFGHYIVGEVGSHGELWYQEAGIDFCNLLGKTTINVIVFPIGLGDHFYAEQIISCAFRTIEGVRSVECDTRYPHTLTYSFELDQPMDDPLGWLLKLSQKFWEMVEQKLLQEAEEIEAEYQEAGL